ncbi:ankyrin neuronal isoform 4 [Brachionus plicatilis]|uniref:Ankyrin neuronal isoform 4 n=1 Tax=Brachionus plicatilis TaxID=10195 RepID=A0A3M7QL41_BRAPC|nr:ankyrin neuronal isoform 4 [Brachionus plicatilis]
MHCFQFFKLRHNKVESCPKLTSFIDKINDLLHKNGKNASLKPGPALQPNDRLGALIFDLVLTDYRATNKIDLDFMHDLLAIISHLKIFSVNNVKNFLNQTLVHFACENNQAQLCQLLVDFGADCVQEDNYLQTPLILAAKRNFLDIVEIFSASLDPDGHKKEIVRAAYYACCAGNCQIVQYLFSRFGLGTEDLVDEKESSRVSELNPLHITCYKSYSDIVVFLLSKFRNEHLIAEYLNSRFNAYRDSTALEETFKGFVCLQSTFNAKKMDQEFKIFQYRKIINFLVEKGARFSANFSATNGLVKLGSQSFSSPTKDHDFFHFLNCCNYLFKFKLKDLFVFVDLKGLEAMMDEFVCHIYSRCLKVVKDIKSKCLNVFIDLMLNLHHTGQYYVQERKLHFLKEKNEDIFNFLVETTRKNLTLKHFSAVSIRNSISNYGIEKVKCLNVPNELKKEIFFSSLSKKHDPEFDYYTFLLFKAIDNKKNFVV